MSQASPSTPVQPPAAKKEFHSATHHGDTVIDPYHWMRSKDWEAMLQDPTLLEPEIRAALEAENAYVTDFESKFAPLTDTVEQEIRGRIIEDDSSIPKKDGEWEYWSAFRKGGQYPFFKRRHLQTGQEQMILDGDQESVGKNFFKLGTMKHSPNQELVAYTVDSEGSEFFGLRFRNIETGVEYPETVPNTKGSVVWSADSSCVYYIEMDKDWKARRVKCHQLGTDPANDVVVYTEPEETYHMSLGETQSGEYVLINSNESSDTSETQYIPANAPFGTKATTFVPRQLGHEYSVDHHDGEFFILTNRDGATNNKIMRTPVDATGVSNWVDFVPYNPRVYTTSIRTLKDHIISTGYKDGLPFVGVSDYAGNGYDLDFPGSTYEVTLAGSYEYDTQEIRVHYETMAMPEKVYDFNLVTKQEDLLKQKVLPNGHNPDDYVIEHHLISARDGAQVPVSILRRHDTPADGTAPLYLYGYGSHGLSMDTSFSPSNISLVDRGIVYAIAHIRGGSEMGKVHHINGRREHKQNTFNDFADAAGALVDMGYGQKGKIIIEGASAGGMLMGASANQRPDLWGAVLPGVAFVDVMNTMLDASLPLTAGEWDEWGNPITSKDAYFRMKDYCPYSNVKDQQYPLIYAETGLTDPRVGYWEPQKFIARLREVGQGGPFFLRTDMSSGHGGSAARFEAVRKKARQRSAAIHIFEDRLGYDVSLKTQPKSAPTVAAPTP
ncbi:MAG: prolyl oligopeptidase family serine peptidase [Alphaproteobacteria bacterium]|nr:prolyl oligopeptidase family serine peptidase [Alphaproteobacteria bacterium]